MRWEAVTELLLGPQVLGPQDLGARFYPYTHIEHIDLRTREVREGWEGGGPEYYMMYLCPIKRDHKMELDNRQPLHK